jgi:hypothetical protein
MKQSLRQKLNDLIRSRGEVSYGELCQYVAELGYRVSTAERRLRHSESPDIEPVMKTSKRGTPYISGYKVGTGKVEREILGVVEVAGERKIIYK